jgi:galactokinase/mevalonate kinase-like predicted kinase
LKVIQASAPGRSGIVGNPSDIYGGVVVSCSAPVRATCRLTVGTGTSLPEDPTLWDAATSRFPLGDVRVEWTSEIPRSSGLAGSTALLAATLACVLTARGERPELESVAGKSAFAELVREVEFYDAGVQCGYQDAYMAVFGGMQSMDFAGKSPAEAGPPATLTPIECDLPFLLVTTGVERLSGSVHGPVIKRWLAGESRIVDAVEEVAELGRLGVAALRDLDYGVLATCMNRNQRVIQAWGGSGAEIDKLVEDCLDAGALAAKLAGAGMGGTVIALSEDLERLEENLCARGYTQFLRPEITPGLRFEEA